MVSFVGLLYFLLRINKIKMPFNKKHSTRELAEYYSFRWRCLRAEETERDENSPEASNFSCRFM